jgi:hypothetical protein
MKHGRDSTPEDDPSKKRSRDGYSGGSNYPRAKGNVESLIVKATKNKATAKWINTLNCAEVIIMKGNFWKTFGFRSDGKNCLHGEEALYLVEKDQLAVFVEEGKYLSRDTLYNMVISDISLECYLTYAKLKVVLFNVSSNFINF